MRPTLTPEQRHLLAFVGRSSGSMLLDAFLEERALRSLLARAGGASGPQAPPGAPDWMTSYWTVGPKFISPAPPAPRSPPPRFNASARPCPPRCATRSPNCSPPSGAESERTWQWCRCGHAHSPRNAHSGPCPRYHPSDEEDDEHYRRSAELHDKTDALLRRVLDLDAGAQLDLFDHLH